MTVVTKLQEVIEAVLDNALLDADADAVFGGVELVPDDFAMAEEDADVVFTGAELSEDLDVAEEDADVVFAGVELPEDLAELETDEEPELEAAVQVSSRSKIERLNAIGSPPERSVLNANE